MDKCRFEWLHRSQVATETERNRQSHQELFKVLSLDKIGSLRVKLPPRFDKLINCLLIYRHISIQRFLIRRFLQLLKNHCHHDIQHNVHFQYDKRNPVDNGGPPYRLLCVNHYSRPIITSLSGSQHHKRIPKTVKINFMVDSLAL